jgi:hypothetical protein
MQKYGCYFRVVMVAVMVVTSIPTRVSATSVVAASSVTQEYNRLEEQITAICLWLGSLLLLIGVPGAFFAYLHDARNKNRGLRWLPIFDGLVLLSMLLIFLSTPIAQFFSNTVDTNLLGKR